jgi:biopolymer transport protein ExbB/TolQ
MLDRRGAIRRNVAMLPRVAWAVVSLLLWIVSASPVQAASAGDGPVWTQGFGAAPGLWAGLTIAAILAVALILHLGFALSENRGSPPELDDALTQAIEAGNYQEAWEACGHWPAAYLSRVLRPALERIGQGRERVTATLARRLAVESRTTTALTWSLLGIGVVLPVIGVLVAWAGLGALLRTDQAAADARALTVAEGNFVLIAAAGLGVAVAALIFWLGFRSRARTIFSTVETDAENFVKDLAYDDLEGLRIGREFDAGTLLGGEEERHTSGMLRVSRELTSSCPQCNAPINFSLKTCPNCGTALAWT